jgi:hypothetical protein
MTVYPSSDLTLLKAKNQIPSTSRDAGCGMRISIRQKVSGRILAEVKPSMTAGQTVTELYPSQY